MLCIRGQQDMPSLLINMLTVRMDVSIKKIMSELSDQLCPLWKVTHPVFENLSSVISTTVEPLLTTTLFIRPPRYYGHILSNQMLKPLSHFIILTTPLIRPPRYYDQDFMAQRWSH